MRQKSHNCMLIVKNAMFLVYKHSMKVKLKKMFLVWVITFLAWNCLFTLENLHVQNQYIISNFDTHHDLFQNLKILMLGVYSLCTFETSKIKFWRRSSEQQKTHRTNQSMTFQIKLPQQTLGNFSPVFRVQSVVANQPTLL